jgi:FKBP-type peptidyl-prolyl cis-trans isomerase/FG-GAP repeat
VNAGAVHVLFGSSSRLTITNNQVWNENSAGIESDSALGDDFGSALAVGQFNSDHVADLAIGIPNEDLSVMDEGSVRVLLGVRTTGLSTTNSQVWNRDNNLLGISIPDAPVSAVNEHLGASLASGDFNGDGVVDLGIGVPHDDGTVSAAGESVLIFNPVNSSIPLGVKMSNGIEYQIIRNGTGVQPSTTSTVSVNYVGTLLNGTVFDSSAMHGGPVSFAVNSVIEGFAIALLGMHVGSEWRVYIPSDLAYGAAGSPPNVGPNEPLIFDVALASSLG